MFQSRTKREKSPLAPHVDPNLCSVGERTPIKMCSLQLYEQPCECHLLFLFCRILLVDHIHTLSKYRNPNLPPPQTRARRLLSVTKEDLFKNVTSWHYIARNSTCILMLIYNKTMSSLPQQKKNKTRSVLAINWLFFRQWHHCVGWQWLRSLRGSVLVFGAFKRWCWDDLVCECRRWLCVLTTAQQVTPGNWSWPGLFTIVFLWRD